MAAILAASGTVAAQGGTVAPSSGGQYANLAPYQQRLFDAVVQRYNAVARTKYTPPATYDGLSPSKRTTFEAVTNALATTALTDAAGAPLGTGIDIVSAIDEIAGSTRGARGDRQFRLDVLLSADAVDRLTRSREFTRTADNAILPSRISDVVSAAWRHAFHPGVR